MIRHVSLLKWKPDTTPEQVEAITTALRALPPQIGELLDYRVGPDAGVDTGNFDFAVVGEFESEAGYETYRDHPAHRAVATELILPHLAERAALQYRV